MKIDRPKSLPILTCKDINIFDNNKLKIFLAKYVKRVSSDLADDTLFGYVKILLTDCYT